MATTTKTIARSNAANPTIKPAKSVAPAVTPILATAGRKTPGAKKARLSQAKSTAKKATFTATASPAETPAFKKSATFVPPAKHAPAGKAVKKVVESAAAVKAPKNEKQRKPKLVRDSFTIPKAEYVVLDGLKQRANQLAQPAKKSELLRAGIKALAAMSDAALVSALKQVPAIKTGRPAAAN